MTLKQLETFYWVFRLGSFIAAAERLNATQSTVSMRIQELEGDLGIALFDRSRRLARPTVHGRKLFDYAERMLALSSEIRQRIGDPMLQSGTVRLGVTELVAVTWLSELVAAINERYPRVVVELNVDLTIDQLRKLANDDIDIALIPGPVNLPDLVQVPLGTVMFEWMASPRLRVPDRVLTPAELARWPLLLLTRQSNLHTKLGSWLETGHPRAHQANFCNSIGVLAELTMAGLGLAYLPVNHYRKDIETGRLQTLKTEPPLPLLEYYAVYNRRNAYTFNDTIADFARQNSGFDQDPKAA